MSETELSFAIATAVARLGGKAIRVQSGQVRVSGGWMHLAEPGTPDRLVLLANGRSVWLEAKTLTGRAREAQQLWAQWARRHGHLVFEVRSVGEAVEACREALR